MKTPTISVSGVTLPYIEYQQQPVVTFAMIDGVHSKSKATARRSFQRNKKHFIEGEDFYALDSERLGQIVTTYPDLTVRILVRTTLNVCWKKSGKSGSASDVFIKKLLIFMRQLLITTRTLRQHGSFLPRCRISCIMPFTATLRLNLFWNGPVATSQIWD